MSTPEGITQCYVPGFSSRKRARYQARREELLKWTESLPRKPESLPTPGLKQKVPDVPVLKSYEGDFADEKYWEKWPQYKPESWEPESWISGEDLIRVAEELEFRDMDRVKKAAGQLKGADIGVKNPKARLGSEGRNLKSASELGHLLADSLADWVRLELVAGPYKSNEVPWKDCKISPLSVQLKPSGAGRVIVDMSYPHRDEKVTLEEADILSINDGINLAEFPTRMDGTYHVLVLLTEWGPGVFLCKQDWSDAYKHIHIRQEDLKLQIIKFGGRYFVDRSLAFGCKSSPGIFDLVSDVVRDLAAYEAGLPTRRTFKCLDDCGTINTKEMCQKFYDAYRRIAAEVGVRLAPESDPEKAFSCCNKGVILGLEYDTLKWTVRVAERKVVKMERTLHTIVEEDSIELGDLKSLSGRINHYHSVVNPLAKWERGFIIYQAAQEGRDSKRVKISKQLKSQAKWWLRQLQVSRPGVRIPDPHTWFSSTWVKIYPDAAGASAEDIRRGMGGVVWNVQGRPMMYYNWPERLRASSVRPDFRSKLTFLEACAALNTACGAMEFIRGRSCVIYSDNIGLAHAWRAGHSRCGFTYSVCKALREVAYYLNCQMKVVWTPRCSSEAETVADLLSKGRHEEATRLAEVQSPSWMWSPRTLLRWLENPYETRVLGVAVCEEMAEMGQVLPREPEQYEELARLRWRPAKRRRDE